MVPTGDAEGRQQQLLLKDDVAVRDGVATRDGITTTDQHLDGVLAKNYGSSTKDNGSKDE